MGNRITIHQEIKDLCKKLKDTNKLLSESNDISMLDIDLLRKTGIEIYDRINQLRLVMSEKIETPVQPKEIKAEEPQTEKQEEPQPRQEEKPIQEDTELASAQEDSAEKPEARETKEETIKEEPQPKPQLVAEENEVAEEEEPQDLASRFGSSPIKDLKREISIAKKFEFINTLFQGNMERYAHSIHRMNGAETGDEAFALLNELREEFSWEEEDKNYMELANLIRRRYLS